MVIGYWLEGWSLTDTRSGINTCRLGRIRFFFHRSKVVNVNFTISHPPDKTFPSIIMENSSYSSIEGYFLCSFQHVMLPVGLKREEAGKVRSLTGPTSVGGGHEVSRFTLASELSH